MPLVKMLKTAAGPLGTHIAGSRVHLDDETAAAWIAVGSAEAVDGPAPETESASVTQPEGTDSAPAEPVTKHARKVKTE